MNDLPAAQQLRDTLTDDEARTALNTLGLRSVREAYVYGPTRGEDGLLTVTITGSLTATELRAVLAILEKVEPTPR